MKAVLLTLAAILFYSNLFATTYYAVTNGNWGSSSTWSLTRGGLGGAGVPSGTDDAYTDGNVVTVTTTSNVKNLFVSHNLNNAITIASDQRLSIFGTLVSWDDGLNTEASPTVQTILFSSDFSRIAFRGSRTDIYSPYVIQNWNTLSPMRRLIFNMGSLTRRVSGSLVIDNEELRHTNGDLIFENDIDFNNNSSLYSAGSSISFNGNVLNLIQADVEDDMVLDGTMNVGTINFDGTASVNLSGLGIINVDIINVSNSTGISNGITINLSQVITLDNSGVFDADGAGSGQLTLLSSNASTTARIAEIPGGASFTGDITYQRTVDGGANWRYFAVPVTNTNLGDWADDLRISGNFSDSNLTVTYPSAPSVYTYDPISPAWTAVDGGGNATSTIPLSNTTGYSVYVYDADETWTVSGAPAQGPISVTLLGSTWNLVPNPYPCSIDWDNVGTSGTANTLVMKYPGAATYATYNNSTNIATNEIFSGWRGEVASGQAVWVDGSGAASVPFTESAKNTSATFLRQQSSDPVFDHFRITLEKGFLIDADFEKDETVILFTGLASDGTDNDYDSKKYAYNGYVSLSTFMLSPSENFAINSVSKLGSSDTKVINLKLENVSPGRHGLRFTDLDKMTLGYKITLIDNYLGKTKVIKSNNDYYAFEVDQNTASWNNNRFDIVISSYDENSEFEPVLATVFPNPSRDVLFVQIEEEQYDNIQRVILRDFEGRTYFDSFGSEFNPQMSINTSKLRNGIYVLKVISNTGEQNFKVYKQ